jgi:Trk K+ transport system NAD-binding subunit
MAGSTYLIMFSENIYSSISKYLGIFEKKKLKKDKFSRKNYEYILVGENRIGFSIMKHFIKLKRPYLIIDFDPVRVTKLQKMKINCVYGDASEDSLFEELNLSSTKVIVSTVPEFETNLIILKKAKEQNKDTIILVTARHISEALKLYKEGADYVILPHFLGGEYVSTLICEGKENKEFYSLEKEKQIKDLKERFKDGQEHPDLKRNSV